MVPPTPPTTKGRDSLLTVVGAGAVLTAAGFITTVSFDTKLGLGIGSSASIGLPLVGGKALLAIALYLLVVCIGLAIVGLIVWLVVWPLRRAGRGWAWLARLERSVSRRWQALRAAPIDRLSAWMAFLSIACLVAVGAIFRPLLATLWSDESSALGCSHEWFHRSYYLVLSGAIGIFSAAGLGAHKLAAGSATPATWQGLAFRGITVVSVLLYLVLALLPWQLLYGAQRQRAILRPNARAYIVTERDGRVVLYVPDSARVFTLPAGDSLLIRRDAHGYPLPDGYLFEEPETFLQKRCR